MLSTSRMRDPANHITFECTPDHSSPGTWGNAEMALGELVARDGDPLSDAARNSLCRDLPPRVRA